MFDFISQIEKKVRQQLASQRVGFLLGAGSSFLGGDEYPLATGLWDVIRERIHAVEQSDNVSFPLCCIFFCCLFAVVNRIN